MMTRITSTTDLSTSAAQAGLVARSRAAWRVLTGGAVSPAIAAVAVPPPVDAPTWEALELAGTATLGPGYPIAPTLVPSPQEQGAPRGWAYLPGYNTWFTPRGNEPGLTAFQILRGFAKGYDIAGLAIRHVLDELTALPWSIVPAPGQPREAVETLAGPIAAVTTKLRRPDGQRWWGQWLGALVREDLEIGAPVIYLRPTRGGGLASLDLVEGDLILPKIDATGRVLGYAETWLGMEAGLWPPDRLLYVPRLCRAGSAYGISPIELVLLAINRDMRRQLTDMAHFTEGNIPSALSGVPEGWGPEEIMRFQLGFDTLMAGNDAAKHQIKFVPIDPSKIKELRPYVENPAYEEWLARIVAAAFGVKLSEMGLSEHATRANAEAQADAQERAGIGPLVRHWETILTAIIQSPLGFRQPLLAFDFGFGGKKEDAYAKAQTDDLNIKNQIYGPFTVRERDGIKLAGGDEALSTPAPPPAPEPAPGAPPAAGPVPPEAAPVAEAPTGPPPENVLLLYTRAALTKLAAARAARDVLAKAGKGPGSRGGKFYIDAKGIVRYGAPPAGTGKHKLTPAERAAKKAAAADRKAVRHAGAVSRKAATAERKATRKALVTAKGNARDQLRGLADLPAMQAAGWASTGPATGFGADRAAANAAASAAGMGDAKSVYAVVKVNGQYFVMSKPISALQQARAARAKNVTTGGVHTQTAGDTSASPPATGGGGRVQKRLPTKAVLRADLYADVLGWVEQIQKDAGA